MKTFLKNICFLALILFFVFGSIEILLLFIPNTYSYKYNYLKTHINDIRVLFLGNSYFEEGIRADLIEKGSFNLASSGRNIAFDAEIARQYFSQMSRLEVVVVPLDYSVFDFGRGVKNPQDKRLGIEAMASSFWCMNYKYLNLHVGPFWNWSEILNSRFNYMSRFWQDRSESVECDSLGYVKLELGSRVSDWECRSLPPIIDTSKPIDFLSYNNYYQNLLTIAKCCQQAGVKFLLVNTPKSELYQKDVNANVMNEISQFVKRIQAECANTFYVDYTYDTDFVDSDFYDACHLTDCGAIKFSVKIRHFIVMNNLLKPKIRR